MRISFPRGRAAAARGVWAAAWEGHRALVQGALFRAAEEKRLDDAAAAEEKDFNDQFDKWEAAVRPVI
jgi:hypothetical protein